MKTTVLVTGGAGYIGSHTCVELLEAGYNVIVLDDLSNSDEEAIRRVVEITGEELTFIRGDVLDYHLVGSILDDGVDAVIHFAGVKSVSESLIDPLNYFHVNVGGTMNVLRAMQATGVQSLVFSSSATVYDPNNVGAQQRGFSEFDKVGPINPYGRSKLMAEDVLRDVWESNHELSFPILRYFNPIGAHPSGLIGEDPQDTPNNLVPYITQTLVGEQECVKVFGADYETTPDGTGVRDYIHVVDLARAHLAALEWAFKNSGASTFNIGTGKGTSVLDMLFMFSQASGIDVTYEIVGRREGDSPICFADPERAWEWLGWRAERSVWDACVDAWHWQRENPQGYRS